MPRGRPPKNKKKDTNETVYMEWQKPPTISTPRFKISEYWRMKYRYIINNRWKVISGVLGIILVLYWLF